MTKGKKVLVYVNLLSFSLFLLMLWTVLNEAWLIRLDRWINTHMYQVHAAWLTPLMQLITDMNSFGGAALFSAVVIAFFLGRRWYRESGFYLFVTLGAALLFSGVKLWVERTRPELPLIEVGGYSFPSGHTTMATAMAFALYFILSGRFGEKYVPYVLFIIALGWALLIASTRLYLGVHWFTDVVGGFGLGLWWVTLVRLVWPGEKGRG
jgi:undecaprenyl-diphosphatase